MLFPPVFCRTSPVVRPRLGQVRHSGSTLSEGPPPCLRSLRLWEPVHPPSLDCSQMFVARVFLSGLLTRCLLPSLASILGWLPLIFFELVVLLSRALRCHPLFYSSSAQLPQKQLAVPPFHRSTTTYHMPRVSSAPNLPSSLSLHSWLKRTHPLLLAFLCDKSFRCVVEEARSVDCLLHDATTMTSTRWCSGMAAVSLLFPPPQHRW